jgi:phosphate transport system substrate-binding protein
MVMLTQAWAETYMKKTPGAQISVTGGGSGTGIAALENKATDIAMSSREIKDEEKQKVEARGGKVQEFIVGRDALTVGVHPSNPVDALTFDQLSDLFTGKVTDWSKVGGKGGKIAVLSREKSSGTHVFFLEHVLRKGNAKGPEEYAPGVLMMPASKAIVDELAKNPSGIGYYGLGYHDPRRVKALAISKKAGEKAIAPSMETVLNNSYPISRPLYLYTSGTPEGPAKQFIDFCSSPEGQAVVEQTGFIPLDKGGAAPRTEKK